jgi:hypothetical protein
VSIPVPNLDDRGFADLVEAARTRIRQVDPEWTDLSVHDPGMVLVEAFAHLTDLLLYRLNRVPDKLYAVYLNLLGTALRPPSAARVTLVFSRPAAGAQVRIPRGTRVACPPGVPGAPQPVFATLADAVLEPAATSVAVEAADVALHEAVVVGVGSGQPGQSFTLPGAPVVDGPGLAVGIEVPAGTDLPSGAALSVEGRVFRTCREVEVFADAEPGEPAVRVDRTAGRLVFPWWPARAPGVAAQGAPGPGTQVRAWYRTGGGERGNVAAGRLTVLRDPLPGLSVTNPDPATGGRDVEDLAEALRRAPQQFQARDRAVTARDYEVLAARHGGVARARALTRRDVWSFAAPGEVEVVLVPHVPAGERADGRIRPEDLARHAQEPVRAEVDTLLRHLATIGASPLVRWGRWKQVAVDARVVVRADEDPEAVRARIERRLAAAISPVPEGGASFASGFGRELRVSNLYRALEQAEPGVRYVDRVRVVLDKAPDTDAVGLVRAEGQPGTWFVGQHDTLFRTTNSADGWEACAVFAGEDVRAISPVHPPAPGRAGGPARPGVVAVATDLGAGSRVYVSEDLGESWRWVAELGFGLADLAWVDRSGTLVLLMAGEKGLYELALAPGAVPVQNLVDPAQPDRGFHTVDALVDVRGRTGVVLAAEASAGVWISAEAGLPESFRLARPPGEDVRCVTVHYDGPATYLWIGRAVPEGAGAGCARLRLDELARTDLAALQGAWEAVGRGWSGGSCWGVAVVGDQVYAATQSGGVVRLSLGPGGGTWQQPDVNCGLPLRDRARFEPVRAVSGAVDPRGGPLVLAGGRRGLLRSADAGVTWRSCSARSVEDVVTLPPTWLFCSGEHAVEVVRSGA